MKKSLLGSFVGISIVLSVDSISRVIIALYMKQDILMFSYSNYPGLLWPILLTVIAGFSAFFGAMFSLTYGRDKQILTFSTFMLLLILFRYGQIHILMDTESIFYPIVSLILSLLALFVALKIARTPKKTGELYESPIDEAHNDAIHDDFKNDYKENPPL